MAAPGTPQNLIVQSANREILVSWDLSAGASSYIVQRSEDNVTYSVVATVSGSPLATQYLDTAVVLETQYWYKVAASNGEISGYTLPQSAVPTPTAEKTLGEIRKLAQQKADRLNSKFVTTQEWNQNINLAMYELYDLLITVYEDYNVATPAQFNSNGSTYQYPLPNGAISFIDGINNNQTIVARPLYKLLGVDMALNTANNAYVTVQKFNFIDRNSFVYPNSNSSIYGVFNCQYRVMGNNIQFIPTPAGNQAFRLWYIPRLKELLKDTDTSDISISGWIQYVIVRAAKYALDKEESDTTKLDQELMYLKTRIEESAANRDAGQPDRISDTRANGYGWGGGGGGWNGGTAGF